MTNYVNPTTRIGGVERVVVTDRAAGGQVDDAPYDDEQYVRVNGEWVPVDTPEIVPDTLAPSPPTLLSSTGQISGAGNAADYTLSWTAPTTNTDATPLTDLAYYVVRWRYGSSGAWTTFVANDPTALLPGLQLGAGVGWEVLARDYSGNDSTWASDTITGLVDTVGPEQPSVPQLSSRLGTVRATWDGLDHAGAVPPTDFSHLEFYTSATTGGPWVYVGLVSGAASVIITDVAVGATCFVTTIAVDTSGNESVRSAEASIVVTGIVGPDIEADAITANELAAGAIDGMVVTGAIIRSQDADSRVEVASYPGGVDFAATNDVRFYMDGGSYGYLRGEDSAGTDSLEARGPVGLAPRTGVASAFGKLELDAEGEVTLGSWEVPPGSGASTTAYVRVYSAGTTGNTGFIQLWSDGGMGANKPILRTDSGGDWKTPSLTSSWVNYGGAFQSAQYRSATGGEIHLRGLVKNGTSGAATAIFTLPTGYRPPADLIFNAAASGGSAQIYISSGGVVQVSQYASGGGNGWVSLSGIIFTPLIT